MELQWKPVGDYDTELWNQYKQAADFAATQNPSFTDNQLQQGWMEGDASNFITAATNAGFVYDSNIQQDSQNQGTLADVYSPATLNNAQQAPQGLFTEAQNRGTPIATQPVAQEAPYVAPLPTTQDSFNQVDWAGKQQTDSLFNQQALYDYEGGLLSSASSRDLKEQDSSLTYDPTLQGPYLIRDSYDEAEFVPTEQEPINQIVYPESDVEYEPITAPTQDPTTLEWNWKDVDPGVHVAIVPGENPGDSDVTLYDPEAIQATTEAFDAWVLESDSSIFDAGDWTDEVEWLGNQLGIPLTGGAVIDMLLKPAMIELLSFADIPFTLNGMKAAFPLGLLVSASDVIDLQYGINPWDRDSSIGKILKTVFDYEVPGTFSWYGRDTDFNGDPITSTHEEAQAVNKDRVDYNFLKKEGMVPAEMTLDMFSAWGGSAGLKDYDDEQDRLATAQAVEEANQLADNAASIKSDEAAAALAVVQAELDTATAASNTDAITIAELEQDLVAAEATYNTALNEQMATAEATQAAIEAQAEIDEAAALVIQSKDYEAQIKTIKDAHTTAVATNDAAASKKLTDTIASMDAQASAASDLAEQKLTAKETELATAKTNIETLKGEVAEAISTGNAASAALQTELDQAEADLSTKQGELDLATTEFDAALTLQVETAAATQEAMEVQWEKDLQAELDAKEQEVWDIAQPKIDGALALRDAAATYVSELNTTISGLNTDKDTLNGQITTLTTNNTDLSSQITTLKTQADTLASEHTAALAAKDTDRAAAVSAAILETNRVAEELASTIEASSSAALAAQEQLTTQASNDVDRLTVELQTAIDTGASNVAAKQTELDTATSELTAAKAASAQAVLDHDKALDDQLKAYNKTIEDVNIAWGKRQAEAVAAKGEEVNAAYTKSLDDANTKYQAAITKLGEENATALEAKDAEKLAEIKQAITDTTAEWTADVAAINTAHATEVAALDATIVTKDALLATHLQGYEKIRDALKAEVSSLKGTIADKDTTIGEKVSQISNWATKYDSDIAILNKQYKDALDAKDVDAAKEVSKAIQETNTANEAIAIALEVETSAALTAQEEATAAAEALVLEKEGLITVWQQAAASASGETAAKQSELDALTTSYEESQTALVAEQAALAQAEIDHDSALTSQLDAFDQTQIQMETEFEAREAAAVQAAETAKDTAHATEVYNNATTAAQEKATAVQAAIDTTTTTYESKITDLKAANVTALENKDTSAAASLKIALDKAQTAYEAEAKTLALQTSADLIAQKNLVNTANGELAALQTQLESSKANTEFVRTSLQTQITNAEAKVTKAKADLAQAEIDNTAALAAQRTSFDVEKTSAVNAAVQAKTSELLAAKNTEIATLNTQHQQALDNKDTAAATKLADELAKAQVSYNEMQALYQNNAKLLAGERDAKQTALDTANATITSKDSTIAELNTAATALTNQYTKAITDNDTAWADKLEAAVGKANAAAETLAITKATEAQAAVDAKQAELDIVNAEVATLEGEKAVLEASTTYKQTEIDDVKLLLQASKDYATQLEGEKTALEAANVTALDDQLKAFEKTQETMEANYDTREAAAVKAANDAKDAVIATANATIAQSVIDIAAAQTQLDAKDVTIEAAEALTTTNNATITQLNAEIVALGVSQASALAAKDTQTVADIAQAVQTTQLAADAVASTNADIAQAALDTETGLRNTAETRVAELEAELITAASTASSDIGAIQTELDTANADLTLLNESVTTLTGKLDDAADAQLAAAEASQKAMEDASAAWTTAIEAEQAKVAAAAAQDVIEASTLKTVTDTAAAAQKALNTTISGLKTSLQEEKDALTTATSEHTTAITTLEDSIAQSIVDAEKLIQDSANLTIKELEAQVAQLDIDIEAQRQLVVTAKEEYDAFNTESGSRIEELNTIIAANTSVLEEREATIQAYQVDPESLSDSEYLALFGSARTLVDEAAIVDSYVTEAAKYGETVEEYRNVQDELKNVSDVSSLEDSEFILDTYSKADLIERLPADVAESVRNEYLNPNFPGGIGNTLLTVDRAQEVADSWGVELDDIIIGSQLLHMENFDDQYEGIDLLKLEGLSFADIEFIKQGYTVEDSKWTNIFPTEQEYLDLKTQADGEGFEYSEDGKSLKLARDLADLTDGTLSTTYDVLDSLMANFGVSTAGDDIAIYTEWMVGELEGADSLGYLDGITDPTELGDAIYQHYSDNLAINAINTPADLDDFAFTSGLSKEEIYDRLGFDAKRGLLEASSQGLTMNELGAIKETWGLTGSEDISEINYAVDNDLDLTELSNRTGLSESQLRQVANEMTQSEGAAADVITAQNTAVASFNELSIGGVDLTWDDYTVLRDVAGLEGYDTTPEGVAQYEYDEAVIGNVFDLESYEAAEFTVCAGDVCTPEETDRLWASLDVDTQELITAEREGFLNVEEQEKFAALNAQFEDILSQGPGNYGTGYVMENADGSLTYLDNWQLVDGKYQYNVTSDGSLSIGFGSVLANNGNSLSSNSQAAAWDVLLGGVGGPSAEALQEQHEWIMESGVDLINNFNNQYYFDEATKELVMRPMQVPGYENYEWDDPAKLTELSEMYNLPPIGINTAVSAFASGSYDLLYKVAAVTDYYSHEMTAIAADTGANNMLEVVEDDYLAFNALNKTDLQTYNGLAHQDFPAFETKIRAEYDAGNGFESMLYMFASSGLPKDATYDLLIGNSNNKLSGPIEEIIDELIADGDVPDVTSWDAYYFAMREAYLAVMSYENRGGNAEVKQLVDGSWHYTNLDYILGRY